MQKKVFKHKFNKGKNKVSIEKNDVFHFLKAQPAGSIDLIITDPAYSGMNNHLSLGKGRIVGKYSEKGTSNGKWFEEFEDTEENYRKFLSLCKKTLKSNGHLYIMFDAFSLLSLGHIVRDFFDVKNVITWDKVNIGMGHYFRRRHEFILFATNGNNIKIKHRSFPDVWRIKRIHRASYPTQKPVELFDIMVSASSKPGYTVCDPFLGSGSAAISAIKYDCDFVGCDISKKAVEISQKRISEFIKTEIDCLQNKTSVPENEKRFW
ncbi:MAG TPA: site-specific DNA-methyltransferase [Candidatus Jorgensenbacteria bacterium]|nr:site-specific DNA-methyltransferase [Candidatus Jorgensenbacteria bacterium]